MTAPVWRGDPALIVYAVRYALGRGNSHAPELCRQAIAANRDQLPAAARNTITADITTWLDGAGATAAPPVREPWVMALAALGVRRRTPVGAR